MSTELAERRETPPIEQQKSEGMMLMEVIQQMCSDPNFDPAKMQQIIDMRKEMFMESARIEFNTAMARVQADVGPVVANADNLQTGSKYAKLDAIVSALKPVYTREGFSVSFGTAECASARLADAGWFRTTAELEHTGGYTKHYHVDLPADTVGPQGKVNKTQIHGAKSAILYARVILMGLMFNFATTLDVDDDGNAAGKGKPPNPDDEPATDEQRTYIDEFLKAGEIPPVTLVWLDRNSETLTVGQAKQLINKLNAAKKARRNDSA